MKTDLNELKLGSGKEQAKILKWASKIQVEVKKCEKVTAELKEPLGKMDKAEKKQNEKPELEAKQRKLEVEAEMERARYEQKLKFECRLEEVKPSVNDRQVNRVKFPELMISKFQGTQIAWFRFWNQFQVEIDWIG